MGALAGAPGNIPETDEAQKSNSNFKSKSAFGGGRGNGNGLSAMKESGPLDPKMMQAGIIRVFQNMLAKRSSSSQQDELPQPPNRPVTTQFDSVRRQIMLNNPGAQGVNYVREF